jgi:threonyl-tRNA synthetase
MKNENPTSLKDHRQIGQEQELFFVHEYAPGAIFWLPKGWIIYQQLVQFIREKIKDEGYHEISTPVMIKNDLFKKSGHWEHFGEHNMFNLPVYENEEAKDLKFPEVNYSLKPMNCPEAALVFAHKQRSIKNFL